MSLVIDGQLIPQDFEVDAGPVVVDGRCIWLILCHLRIRHISNRFCLTIIYDQMIMFDQYTTHLGDEHVQRLVLDVFV